VNPNILYWSSRICLLKGAVDKPMEATVWPSAKAGTTFDKPGQLAVCGSVRQGPLWYGGMVLGRSRMF
jgi:hypothetical protein